MYGWKTLGGIRNPEIFETGQSYPRYFCANLSVIGRFKIYRVLLETILVIVRTPMILTYPINLAFFGKKIVELPNHALINSVKSIQ